MAAENTPAIRVFSDRPEERALTDLGFVPPASTQASTYAAPTDRVAVPRWRRTSTWLLVYGVALALIVFWPEPVDSGFSPLLRRISALFPLLTYERIEFGSNILLFVPLGVGLSLLLCTRRHLVVPLGFLGSLAIESIQALVLADRTPSVFDIVANVAGTCLGLIAVAAFEGLRSAVRSRRDRERQMLSQG